MLFLVLRLQSMIRSYKRFGIQVQRLGLDGCMHPEVAVVVVALVQMLQAFSQKVLEVLMEMLQIKIINDLFISKDKKK